jgi:hypothetical protein
LARQTVSTRGQFAGVVGGEPQPSLAQFANQVLGDGNSGLGRLVAQVQRITAERRVRRGPAEAGGLRQGVREGLSGEQAAAERGSQFGRAELLVAPLAGVQVEERGAGHVPGRALPVKRERDLLPARQRTNLLLADVVGPAAAVDPLAAAQHDQREERAVDLVGVEPVVGAGAHRDHRPALGQFRVAGELPGHPGRRGGGHRRDRLLPRRGAWRPRVVVSGRPFTGQALPRHGVLRHQQVEHRWVSQVMIPSLTYTFHEHDPVQFTPWVDRTTLSCRHRSR